MGLKSFPFSNGSTIIAQCTKKILDENMQLHAVDFLFLRVSFMCYVYSNVLIWCFRFVISAKHAKWQHMMAITAK